MYIIVLILIIGILGSFLSKMKETSRKNTDSYFMSSNSGNVSNASPIMMDGGNDCSSSSSDGGGSSGGGDC